MPLEKEISLSDLVLSLSDLVDLVSPKLAGHHQEVAYIAGELAREYGLPAEQRSELITAGALHDIGALSLTEKLAAMQFELKNPSRHAEMSYRLLKTFAPFSRVADIVRFHHVYWNGGAGAEFLGESVPLGSHILHLADRISVLRNKNAYVLNQAGAIRDRIKEQSGVMFVPDLVEAFLRLSEKQSFWLTAASPRMDLALAENAEMPVMSLDMCELLSLTKLFAHIIDFRSKYTATHSAGVAAVGKTLAALAGFDERDCGLMEIAGYLHDLGKLAVPAEILEKPGKLTREEYNVIFSHPFYTYRALQRIRGFGTICNWASNHHERLNGSGYPFHHPAKELERGARVIAVADVFTAILEDRPYQKDMTVEAAMAIIRRLADNSGLDPDLAALLRDNLDKVNAVRVSAQAAAAEEYRRFNVLGDIPLDGKCTAGFRPEPARL